MPRTTSVKVAEIIEVDPAIGLDPFILPANLLVTEVCASAGYSEERLEVIETYLAAHFYTLRDPRRVMEKAGPVAATYQSKVDLGLNTSHYGQHAMLLDTAGGLSALNNKKGVRALVASVTWVGTDPDEVS